MRDFHMPGRSAVMAERGMVATSHPAAALMGVETLRRGGSAADAAVAAALALGVCEPHMCGIGGDCFALVHVPDRDVEALNGSGRAPEAASAQRLRAKGARAVPLRSPEAVTMPGAVDGMLSLLERHGRLGRDAVIAPVADLFERGVRVAPRVAFDWGEAAEALQGGARDTYLPGGATPDTGARFALPGQAEVLRRVARDGRDAFYAGEVAEDMIAALRKHGGRHDAADLANVSCDWGGTVEGTYRGVDLLEHPPNGQGATAILLANILSRFDIADMEPMGARRIHLEAEATRLAYDARDRFVADRDHAARMDHMLSPRTAAALADLIDPRRRRAPLLTRAEAVHRDTVLVTAVDEDRMAVTLIYSLFHGFGSGIATDRFGILFHNRGAGFTLDRWHPNELAGGKRPMHTIIPAMTRRGGRIETAFGVMGGAYQACGHARMLSNVEDFGMDWQSAIDAPRAFAEGGRLKVERGYGHDVQIELYAMGHDVVVPRGPIGGAQAIRMDAGGWLEGASDPRKDGCALGY